MIPVDRSQSLPTSMVDVIGDLNMMFHVVTSVMIFKATSISEIMLITLALVKSPFMSPAHHQLPFRGITTV